MKWPIMPPNKGQSPVLFEDGYAEGWAKCLSQCQQAYADRCDYETSIRAAVESLRQTDWEESGRQLTREDYEAQLTVPEDEFAGIARKRMAREFGRIERMVDALPGPLSQIETECPRCAEVFYLSESKSTAVLRPAATKWPSFDEYAKAQGIDPGPTQDQYREVWKEARL